MMEIKLLRPLPNGIGRVSQWFGEHPEWYAIFKLAGHNGVDYAAPLDTPVLAAHAGRIEIGNDPAGYGNYIRVIGSCYLTIYAHLNQINVVHGSFVLPGHEIGRVGNTGNSTGPHLHWGLKIPGMRNPAYLNWIDPVPFREN